ncbi:MAG: hypothetical protein Q9227_001067 [Pyrenula ochraceoflavens]
MECPFNHAQLGIDPSKLEKIPQPPMKYLGLLGHLPEIDSGFPVNSLWKLMDKHGPLFEVDLNGRRVLVGNHEIFKELLDEDTWLKQPSKAQIILRDVGRDALVTAYSGEKNWGIARRLLNPAFEINSQLVLMWDRHGPENEIECVQAFSRLTFDTIGLCAFNVRFNEFYMPQTHPFVEQLSQGLIECGRRANRPNFVNNWLFFRAEKRRQENMDRMRELSQEIIHDREVNPKPEATDILNILLHAVDKETGEKLPIENVRAQVSTFLAAGYDTTASSLSFVYYYLCDNPDTLSRAQQEVDEVVGDKVVTVDMLPRLSYLSACIKESLRLNSPVNILNRDATKDVVLGEKYFINKGMSVSTLLRHLHRDPKVWGDDADLFRPERMLDGGFEALPPTAWKPFGNGARVCIGQGFAEQEMLINLSQVLQRFHIQKADPTYKLVLRATITTKPDNFKIKVRRRPGRTIMFGIPGGATSESAQVQPPQHQRVSRRTGKSKSVCVFVGGNMGTCEGLAHNLAEKGPDFGLEIEIQDLNAAVENLPADKPCVIITASYEGKPPDNAKKFVAWIEQLSHESKKLPQGMRYAVFGAGNSDWASTFHRIPKLVDDMLAKLGADRIIEACHSNVKLDVMGPWEEWSEQLCMSLSDTKSTSQASVGVEVNIENASTRSQIPAGDEMCSGTVLSSRELADTSVGAAKQHVDIRLPPNCNFASGDYLVIQGRNPEESVQRVLARFGLARHDMMTVKNSKKSFLPTEPAAVGHFLSTSVELATPITRRQLSVLLHWTEDSSEEHMTLEKMQEDETHGALLKRKYSIIDVLEEVPELRLPFGVYLDLLLPLTPRQYSFSSSLLEEGKTGNEEYGPISSVTFDVLEAPAMSGHGTFRGVVSNHLSTCRPGDHIQCVVRPNTLGFHLPASTETPMIMIAAGTGIAPIRAFIAERAALQQTGKHKLGPAILYFGCRHPDKDYIYRSDLEKWQALGAVEVVPCFSRPDPPQRGRHVPDALWSDRDRVWDLFYAKGAKVYVCGSAAKLGRSSADVLRRICMLKMGKGEGEADEWLEEMKNKGMYVRDVY